MHTRHPKRLTPPVKQAYGRWIAHAHWRRHSNAHKHIDVGAPNDAQAYTHWHLTMLIIITTPTTMRRQACRAQALITKYYGLALMINYLLTELY